MDFFYVQRVVIGVAVQSFFIGVEKWDDFDIRESTTVWL